MGKELKTEIKLDFPIKTSDNRDIQKIEMRRCTVGDQLAASHDSNGDQVKAEIRLFGNLCDLSYEDMLKIDAKDYAKIQEIYKSFLE